MYYAYVENFFRDFIDSRSWIAILWVYYESPMRQIVVNKSCTVTYTETREHFYGFAWKRLCPNCQKIRNKRFEGTYHLNDHYTAIFTAINVKKTSQFKKVFNGDTAYNTQLKQQK